MTIVFDKFAISEHLVSTDKICRVPQVMGRPEITYSKKLKTMIDNRYQLMAISCMAIGK